LTFFPKSSKIIIQKRKGNKKMANKICCPYCGSTKKLTHIKDKDNFSKEKLSFYKCKCGCEFATKFVASVNYISKTP
jgi:hypothetical protein